MNGSRVRVAALMVALLALAGCGGGDSDPDYIGLSGTLSTADIGDQARGPILVVASRTDDMDLLESNPRDMVVEMVTADSGSMTFQMDLGDKNIRSGDPLYIFAFVDNNYAGDVPYPDVGDFVGFFLDDGSLTPEYRLEPGLNDRIDININREVFSFDAEVTGIAMGEDFGDLFMVAYCGEMISSDISDLDTDFIIGYQRIRNHAMPTPYRLPILPYGFNVPIDHVFVFAVLDKNQNGRADGGDRLGFHSLDPRSYPTLITIEPGVIAGIDTEFVMDIAEEFPGELSISGGFAVPPEYEDSSPPIYIIAARTRDPEMLFDDPFSVIKYFYRLPEGTFFFDRDVARTGLLPGDEIMLFALWDRDYGAGFPNPTRGDRLGLLQNKTSYAFTAELEYGKTSVPTDGYEWNISKNIYNFSSEILYALDLRGSGEFDTEVAQIMVLALHVEGIEIRLRSPATIDLVVNMDYLLGASTIPATVACDMGTDPPDDLEHARRLSLLPTVDSRIGVFENAEPPDPLIEGVFMDSLLEKTAYLIMILDKNGNGRLDAEDEIGYRAGDPIMIDAEAGDTIDIPGYGEVVLPDWALGTYYFPCPIPRITSGENAEVRGDGTVRPYRIRMSRLPIL